MTRFAYFAVLSARFLVGFLLISCCRDEKAFWQCPCRPRRDGVSESAKTSTTNVSTLNHVRRKFEVWFDLWSCGIR